MAGRTDKTDGRPPFGCSPKAGGVWGGWGARQPGPRQGKPRRLRARGGEKGPLRSLFRAQAVPRDSLGRGREKCLLNHFPSSRPRCRKRKRPRPSPLAEGAQLARRQHRRASLLCHPPAQGAQGVWGRSPPKSAERVAGFLSYLAIDRPGSPARCIECCLSSTNRSK